MPGVGVVQLVQLAEQHQRLVLALRDRTSSIMATLWQQLMTNPSDYAAGQWLNRAVPLLTGAESVAASAALSFITTYIGAATGTMPTTALTPTSFLNPRGVDPTTLLMRPVIEMRSTLAQGGTMADAIDAGQNRAEQIGSTDPMLSYRAASSEAMQESPHVVGYRRVPDSKACSFCLLVATQRYHDADLMALHPFCGCTVAPIIGSKDPGRIIDHSTLDRLKSDGVLADITRRRQQAAAAAQGADAGSSSSPPPPPHLEAGKQLIHEIFTKPSEFVTVHQHGELGPTLYEAGHHFEAA